MNKTGPLSREFSHIGICCVSLEVLKSFWEIQNPVGFRFVFRDKDTHSYYCCIKFERRTRWLVSVTSGLRVSSGGLRLTCGFPLFPAALGGRCLGSLLPRSY